MVYTIFFRIAQFFALIASIAAMAREMGYLPVAQLETTLWHMLGLSVCGAIGTQCVFLFRNSLKKLQYIKDIPTSKIGSAKQGYVKLKGTLILPEGHAPLLSALSQTACLWWEYEIYKYRYRKKKGESPWKTIDSDHSNNEFYIADDTGRCKFNPQGATIIAQPPKIWEGNKAYPQNNIDKETLPERLARLSDPYRYEEHVLLPGQAVYVLGYLSNKNGYSYLEKPPDEQPFILSNLENAQNQLIRSGRINAGVSAVVFIISVIVAATIAWHWQS